MQPQVTRISIASVKSLGLQHPEEVVLERGGVRGNRRFWLVDEQGRLFNNKRNGPMVRVRTEWDEDSRVLAITFPDGRSVTEYGGTKVPLSDLQGLLKPVVIKIPDGTTPVGGGSLSSPGISM